MTDIILLLALYLVLVCLVAPAAGGFIAWARGEWELMRAKTWQGDHLVNPALGTANDERVAKMVLRQRAFGKRLRRAGRSLISKGGKEYVPILTKPAPIEERPPKAEKVVPIRQPQKIAR